MASDTLTYAIRGGPHAASDARAVVTRALEGLVDSDRLAVVRLLVSELVTNGVLHGDAGDDAETLTLRIATDRTLRVDVIDHGHGFVAAGLPREPNGGWGLVLVEALADRWGVTRNGETRVWFEIAA